LLLKIPPVRSFLALHGKERKIYLEAFSLLVIIRMGMWVIPYNTLQRNLNRLFPVPLNAGRPQSPEVILSARKLSRRVREVSGFVPEATCLAQALTLQALLSGEDIHSDLAIGVTRGDEAGGIAAHAWLEVEGTVIIGGEERERFTRLKML
jgi:hypothetical protein